MKINDHRAFHRWAGTFAALFLAFLALTGVALQLDLWIGGRPPPGSEERAPAPPPIALPDDATLSAMLTTATRAMRERHPQAQARSIQLDLGAKPRAIVIGGVGPEAPRVTIDLLTGRDVPQPKRSANFHNLLQDLHAGYRFGLVGRLISVAVGVALLVLSITGLTVYLDMFRRRRKAGKREVFWR